MNRVDELLDLINRVIQNVQEIDLSLIDVEDRALKTIVDELAFIWSSGQLDITAILGIVGQAYAAGRMRGRKESLMNEMLKETTGETDTTTALPIQYKRGRGKLFKT